MNPRSNDFDAVAREAAMRQLGTLVKDTISAEVDPFTATRGRARLVASSPIARERPRRGARTVRWIAAALVPLAFVVTWALWPERPMDYSVHGTAPDPNGYVRVLPESPPTRLAFSDGSHVAFHAGTRGRLAELTSRGARVAIEQGSVALAVRPRPGARWSVHAGPFAVEVTGTRFDVSWEPSGETLNVRLYEGSLIVTGPLARDGIRMRGGEVLVARLNEPGISIGLLSDEVPVASPSHDASSPGVRSVAKVTSPRMPVRPMLEEPTIAWSEHLRHGRFEVVLREAEARGVASVLRRAGSSELAALADAARYAGRHELAKDAYLAQRKRFPISGDARMAAFLLGRLAEDHFARPDEALGWFERYLRESPRGPFAAEALGRVMVLEQKRNGHEAASKTARLYLARYPTGGYAKVARELLSAQAGPQN